jgi:hypothetical protein
MLLMYLPALIFEASLEMLTEPARRSAGHGEHDHPAPAAQISDAAICHKARRPQR